MLGLFLCPCNVKCFWYIPFPSGIGSSAYIFHQILKLFPIVPFLPFLPVHLSLPLSSSLPASLSDESVMTPDVENATISPILPFLFLGNERDAEDLDLLLQLNIGYVVNITTHLPLYHLDTGLVRYKRLPATDNSRQNLRQYFEEVFEFIGEGKSDLSRSLCAPVCLPWSCPHSDLKAVIMDFDEVFLYC